MHAVCDAAAAFARGRATGGGAAATASTRAAAAPPAVARAASFSACGGRAPRAARLQRAASWRVRAREAADAPEEEELTPLEQLQRDFELENAYGGVFVDDGPGPGGMLRVQLVHASGSTVRLYLLGATVTSWCLPNGSDVLYIREDADFDGATPIKGGIPIAWPQYGRGGAFAGGVLGEQPLPENGFVNELQWELVETGINEADGEPYVILRCSDTESTRELWPHAFELLYQVSLGERQLTCSLGVRNAGEERFAFTAALAPHLGVSDAWDDAVSILGLTGSAYLDNLAHPEKPRVRLQTGPVVRIKQPTEHVYVNTQPRVALEVGTGCTVFVENTQGFTDHVVWNPFSSVPSWPNFVSVQSAVAAQPVKLAPNEEWAGTCTLFVRDVMLSEKIIPRFQKPDTDLGLKAPPLMVPEFEEKLKYDREVKRTFFK